MGKGIKKKGILILLILIVLAAVFWLESGQFLQKDKKESADISAYKTETVRRGAVSTGVSESGTVEFGTQEQIFSVAEITEVSISESDDSEESQSGSEMDSGSSGAGNKSGQNAGSAPGMDMGSGNSGSTYASSGTEDTSGEVTSLTVEEVYLATGQAAKAGDKVLKITQESIEEYRNQLEQAVETARLKVSQEEINVESKKTDADYTYEMYLAEGETAEETYNATITSLETAVSDLEEELAEATDEDEIEELDAELKIARNNLSTQSIEAKQAYEKAVTNYKYAKQLYEIDTNGLEDDLNDAKEILEEANQNLADFEEQIGDGIVYAEYSGTVTEIAYAAGDTLTNDGVIAVFTDGENVTMTVSVSQEDISRIAVGDEAKIELTAYENKEFPGEITGISTSTSAGSATVNYDVAVRFTGDISKVYSGMTGNVVFAGKTVEDTLYISNRAVSQEGTRSYVKILEDDGNIREEDIKTGFSNGSIVEVQSGLEEGQKVIIESKVVP